MYYCAVWSGRAIVSATKYRPTLSLGLRQQPLWNRTCKYSQSQQHSKGSTKGKVSLIERLRKSWVPLPAGVGITLLAVLQWRRLHPSPTTSPKHWQITCYKALPLRCLSRLFGWVSESYIPVSMRPAVYSWFAKIYAVNTDEMAHSLDYYSSLSNFFTRQLKHGARPIDVDKSLVSPADGTVLNAGRLSSFNIEQVKGVTYSIKTFLGETSRLSKNQNDSYRKEAAVTRKSDFGESWTEYKNKLVHNSKNELYQCVVYLAPGDYHRFHSPADWKVTHRTHFQGELMSVNPKYASWIPDLFALNERVVYTGSWEHGYFSMTAVGATNVGSIKVYNDKSLETNKMLWKSERRDESEMECRWSKGEEIGQFRMGSTLVLIFEAPPDFKLDLAPSGHKVKVGNALTHATSSYQQQQQSATTTNKPA